jgi:chromosome partitioning protein
LKRPIAARVLLTQMSPLMSRVALHARQEIQQAVIPVMKTEIIARAAYQAMHFTGATPSHPSGDPKAAREISAVLVELIEILAQQQQAAA